MVTSEDQMFHEARRLVGTEVEVGIISTSEVLRGKVAYAMFDSILIEAKPGQNRAIPFRDIQFLTPS